METSVRERPTVYEFFAPGLKPDVRLKVFDTSEYHVHSVLLKLYSGFFLKFLDSPEKKVPASPDFTYEWVTQVDDDSSWHLTGNLPDQKKQMGQENAFYALIRAIYSKPFMICHTEELIPLFELADYYCALRVVSRGLDEAMKCGEVEGLIWDLEKDPCRFLRLAIRLRNETLFKECLCLSLGPWTEPVYYKCRDKEVFKICEQARMKLYAHTGRVNEGLVKELNRLDRENPFLRDEMVEHMKKASANSNNRSSDKVYLPQYYRKLGNFKSSNGRQPFWDSLQGLLDNKLTFARDARAGEGDFVDFFLCESLGYDELPWDQDEDDW
ncbi:hypothetical protein BDZ45DRAFT_810907 [Acephala macrosclerotiorum]|nr:hypothetical protein BDZ45DRAFT_810907 [Acephala macrosclerotiorum]